MARRFNNGSDMVEFGIAPFNGYTLGAFTCAIYLKRASTANACYYLFMSNSTGGTQRWTMLHNSGAGGAVTAQSASTGPSSGVTTGTANFVIIVITCPGSGGALRFHFYDGSSWAHNNRSGGAVTWTNTSAIGATDRLFVNSPAAWGGVINGDVVCAGIKKSDTATDAGVETLSPLLFSSWVSFGFEWLVGFETNATQTNRANPGTGDEVARTGGSLVADPASWDWTTTVASTFVPQIVMI